MKLADLIGSQALDVRISGRIGSDLPSFLDLGSHLAELPERADEAPEQEVIFVEDPEPTGPFGAKAVAEICINGPAPAIANALEVACGVRLRETPLSPEKVKAALAERQP